MHRWALFPHGKTRSYHEGLYIYSKLATPERPGIAYKRQTLDQKRPKSKESSQDKPGQYTLDLRNPRTSRVPRQRPDEVRRDERESGLSVTPSAHCLNYPRQKKGNERVVCGRLDKKRGEGGVVGEGNRTRTANST